MAIVALLVACRSSGNDESPDAGSFAPSCSDPPRGALTKQFADVTRESGIDFVYSSRSTFKGGGLAVADFDGDGLPDLVAGSRDGGMALYRNRGSLRFRAAADAGFDGVTLVSALAAADLDNDGDRDLVVANPDGIVHVMANGGDARFSEAARLENTGTTEHVLPVDVDGDGLLDLYLGNYDVLDASRSVNRLYLGRGSLAYSFARELGAGLTWSTTAFDYDRDGDQDLYVANDNLVGDYGRPVADVTPRFPVDLFLINEGTVDGIPQFTDIAGEIGLARPRSSMGGNLGDFDRDGVLDLFVPDLGANKVFLRDGVAGYRESAEQLGLSATFRVNELCDVGSEFAACLVLSWSAALADFDLDGHDELIVVNGGNYPGDVPPLMFFERGTEPVFREWSMGCADARSVIAADLDRDGDQDIVIARHEGPLVVYENRGVPAAGTWLRIALRGTASNREGIGATVVARMTSGRTRSAVVGAGGVIHSAPPVEVVLGLGEDTVERLDIEWPSGRRTRIAGPFAGTSLEIAEP